MVTDNAFAILFINLRNLIRFLRSTLHPEQKLGSNEETILQKIHQKRFNQSNKYLITGGHFSDLFVRNTGIFYNSILDPRIPSTQEDYNNRQLIIYKTVTFALDDFLKYKKDTTTISLLTSKMSVVSNIYARASDSLYSILYGLVTLQSPDHLISLYPSTNEKSSLTFNQDIKAKTLKIINTNTLGLESLLNNYFSQVLSDNYLIKKDLNLSSARDGIKRSSSFYDNVIAHSTAKLALKLNLNIRISKSIDLTSWKNLIIQTYWNDQTGIFNDDLNHKSFSADQLITLSTGFLELNHQTVKEKYYSIISYIQSKQLDQPFPLHYSDAHNPKQLYWPVRIGAPHYMTHSIWSHWGIEYIKLLILLSSKTNEYQETAKKHLNSYRQNIEQYGGYPECYDLSGKPLQESLYKTVLHTSWVINYEQAKMLLNRL